MADYDKPFTLMPNQSETLPPIVPNVPIIVDVRNDSNTITEVFIDAGSHRELIFMVPQEAVCGKHFISTGLPINVRNVDPEGDSPVTVRIRALT